MKHIELATKDRYELVSNLSVLFQFSFARIPTSLLFFLIETLNTTDIYTWQP